MEILPHSSIKFPYRCADIKHLTTWQTGNIPSILTFELDWEFIWNLLICTLKKDFWLYAFVLLLNITKIWNLANKNCVILNHMPRVEIFLKVMLRFSILVFKHGLFWPLLFFCKICCLVGFSLFSRSSSQFLPPCSQQPALCPSSDQGSCQLSFPENLLVIFFPFLSKPRRYWCSCNYFFLLQWLVSFNLLIMVGKSYY